MEAQDIIAILALVIFAILLGLGIDGEVKAMMGFVIGFYFHTAINETKKAIKHGGEK